MRNSVSLRFCYRFSGLSYSFNYFCYVLDFVVKFLQFKGLISLVIPEAIYLTLLCAEL